MQRNLILALLFACLAGGSAGFAIGIEMENSKCDARVEMAQDNVSMKYAHLSPGWYSVIETAPERGVALVASLDTGGPTSPFVVREMPKYLGKGKKFSVPAPDRKR